MSWDKSKFKTYDTSKGFGNARQWKNSFHDRMGAEEAAKIMSEQPETAWDILGLKGPFATQEEIKTAFRKLVMFWHPDRNKDPRAEMMTKKIIAAYTTLKS